MARSVNRLTATTAKALRKPGRHADGNGLFLSIDGDGRRRWVLLFTFGGRRREMGIGSADDVSLAEARRAAEAARALVRQGQDPIEHRRAVARDASTPTFGTFCDDFLRDKAGGWRNPKHRQQWAMTLSRARDDDGELLDTGYCLSLRHRRVDEIDTDDVLAALRPIWGSKSETASRLRGRIEAVLDAAKAAGHRTGDNPAAWRGHLSLLLPKPKKLARGHHAAMPFASVPALMERLRERQGVASLALQFAILTAARSGEVRGATWQEVGLDKALWTIPAARMKAGREHRVPLSNQAIEVLRRAAPFRSTSDGDDALVFPGSRRGAPLSDMSLSAVLRRLDLDCTVHGFRSSFRDWCGDATSFPRELAEQALAHVIGSKVEAAYRRGDALAKRRELMSAWAAFLTGKTVADDRDLRDAMRALAEGKEATISADVAKLIIERLTKAKRGPRKQQPSTV